MRGLTSSPNGDLAKLRRGEDRRPLALGKGGGAGSYSLSRWERVGVRAGGGGGRATLLKPARQVTQSSPTGEERGEGSCLLSQRRPCKTPSRGRPPPAGLGKGRRRGVLLPLPLGEGWGEGGGRRGPRNLAEARPPSYPKLSQRERIEVRGPATTTQGHPSPPPHTTPRGENGGIGGTSRRNWRELGALFPPSPTPQPCWK